MAKGLEIERRWLLGGWDEEALTGRRRQIIQGYFDDVEDASKRIRIIDESEAVMTLKRGEGKVREEQETALGLDEARLQLAASVAVIRKARVKQSGWDVDFFAEPFGDIAAGRPLVVAEKELETEGEAVNLPGWMHEAIEVTGLLCTEMLADFAASLEFGESSEVAEDWEMPGKAWAVFVCGGTPDQRRRML